MSVAAQLLDQVRAAGGTAEINDGKVRLRAPRALPGDLVDALRSRKAEIIDLLAAECADQVAARWGKLSSIVTWFLATPPPAAPFILRQGITIRDPVKFWNSLRVDIEAGPGTRRDFYGAVGNDLMRLWRMFGPGTSPPIREQ